MRKHDRKQKVLTAWVLVLALIPLFFVDAGGKKEQSGSSGGKLSVFVSIPPQEYFVRRIAGERADIHVLVPRGQDPHVYEPKPSQIIDLGSSDIYFTIGLDFEKIFTESIRKTVASVKIVDCSEGITPLSSGSSEADKHVWLGLPEAKIIASHIKNAFIAADPDRKEEYTANFTSLSEDIDRLQKNFSTLFSSLKGKTFLVFHPAFGYFARSVGLIQKSIEVKGNEPSAKQLEKIIAMAKKEGIRILFVQPQFSRKSAQTIADSIGAAVVTIDPLSPDWMKNMETIAETLRKALGGS